MERNIFQHSQNGLAENIIETPIHYWVQGCGVVITNNQVAKCMFKGWKNSFGHYSNMISPFYYASAIGISCDFMLCKGTQHFY